MTDGKPIIAPDKVVEIAKYIQRCVCTYSAELSDYDPRFPIAKQAVGLIEVVIKAMEAEKEGSE